MQRIAVLLAALLPAANAPWAGELIEPTRTLHGANKPEGELMVFSEPPGLPVALDGVSLGKTPASVKQVEPGIHSLRVESKETKITIEEGQTLAISLFKGDFVRIPEPEEPPVQPPEKEVTPRAATRRSPAASEEYQPPALSPIEHYRMFGYY